jgi:small-conductance mechanosensitive channel
VRFFIYLSATTACVLLSVRLTKELMLALGGSIAVMVGFGFKDLAASLIAGIIILFDRPFQVGDRVTFGGYYGEIAAIGMRSVRLITLDDNLVTIPNNKFLTDLVASGNAGALDMLVQMDFFIGLDQHLARAKQIVADAITSTRYAYLQKPYTVLVNEVMLDSHLAVRLRAKVYVLDVRYEKALETDVTERVLGGFRDAGIQPPAILHRSVVSTGGGHPESAADGASEGPPDARALPSTSTV